MTKKAVVSESKRPQKYKAHEYTRCERCGRPYSVLRKYKLCRICFRELAYKGRIPGMKEASWWSDRRNTVTIITDPIVDMPTRVRSTLQARHETVEIPASKEKIETAKILKNEGFTTDYTVDGDVKRAITVTLKYGPDNRKVINGLKRVSKPGLHVYAKVDSIPCMMNELGVTIISIFHGAITDKEVKTKHVSGEAIAHVW